VISYKEFVGRPQNIIAGESAGTSERGGDNAKLVLDALPSTYDFPAVITSMEKILTEKNFEIRQLEGNDQELEQSAKEATAPEVVEIPFAFAVVGGYDPIHDLIKTLEQSIRPIQLTKLTISAD